MGAGWPKRLEWLTIEGLRGWTGQRFELRFPIMAVTGENGVGKSTVLQSAAAVYRGGSKLRFASDFFPDTAWDRIEKATIRYSVKEGNNPPKESTIRKPGTRWRGNPERPERPVQYIDLSRIQPVSARLGYIKLAKPIFRETEAEDFDKSRLGRFSSIMGRTYDLAKMALTDGDLRRRVPVVSQHGSAYSGFHQGAGETTVAELLQADIPKYSLVLIDEIETSLHPRSQRRLIRDLANKCRELELQVVLTTHSPYVLEELPLDARAYIINTLAGREIVYGVSPEFAMTKMDDTPHPECDIYVEDIRAQILLVEILAAHAAGLVQRVRIIPYGAASVGKALGQMVAYRRFPVPSVVFLDGDQGEAPGCFNLPGEDPPERVVFEALRQRGWSSVPARIGRSYPETADTLGRAMALGDHHDWITYAATQMVVGGDTLWQALCAEWAAHCLTKDDALRIAQPIEDALIGVFPHPAPSPTPPPPVPAAAPVASRRGSTPKPSSTEQPRLFEQ